MDFQNTRVTTDCLCKRDLQKFTTLPIILLGVILLIDTSLNITTREHQMNIDRRLNTTDMIQKQFLRQVSIDTSHVGMCDYQHAVYLDKGIYLKVCNEYNTTRIDIRRYTTTSNGEDIPTGEGVYLSISQWKKLATKISVIKKILQDTRNGYKTSTSANSYL